MSATGAVSPRRCPALVLAWLLLACLIAGCGGAPKRRASRIPIVVAQVERRTVPYEIEATGTVEPIQSADVSAQVAGIITRVAFREGDEVKNGQVLFSIDRRPFEAAAARASAVLAKDRAQAETAQLDLVRAETLAKQGLIAAGELDQKRADATALSATARADSAALIGARLDLSNSTVRAPIGGKSGNLHMHVGDLVRAGDPANPLVTINQIHPIRVRFNVPQSDLPALQRGRQREMRVDVAPADRDSTWIQGRLTFVDNQVDANSGTLLLKGEFANREGELWPGQFVRVRLRLDEQADATVVPAVAVSSSQSGPYLFVVKPDTTVETRPVKLGRTWRDWVVIAGGVEPGETVVTDGQLRLSPGSKAMIRSAAANPGSRPQ
jgi:multidrug efflux system membrane fusion protein